MFKAIALGATAMMMFAKTATADECCVIRLNYLKAIKASSGTSDKVIDEIAKMGSAFENAAAVISAIDEDRDDPDDLFLTLSIETDDDSAFWPAPNENTELARVGTKVNLSGI